MALFGKLTLYCPNCSNKIRLDSPVTTVKSLAIQCSRECYDAIELKTVRSILGKDEMDGE